MKKFKLIEAFIIGLLLGAAMSVAWFIVFVFLSFLVLGSQSGSLLFPLLLLGVPLLTFIYLFWKAKSAQRILFAGIISGFVVIVLLFAGLFAGKGRRIQFPGDYKNLWPLSLTGTRGVAVSGIGNLRRIPRPDRVISTFAFVGKHMFKLRKEVSV